MNTDKEKIERVIAAIITAACLFSASSYLPAVPVYIIVPIFISFIITFIISGKKTSPLWVISIVSAGSIFFSAAPNGTGISTPEELVVNIIAKRQREMLTFSPPLLLGLLGGVLGWGLAVIHMEYKKLQKYIFWFMFIALLINTVWISLDLNPDAIKMASEEPSAGMYNNFNSLNIKTFYLMKRGLGFYEAYGTAYSLRAESFNQLPSDLWSWRKPVVFYLWHWLLPDDGFYILYLYILAYCISLYLIMDIAKLYLKPPLCLIPCVLSAPVFIYGTAGYWFTFPEYWGLFFLLLGLWGIAKNNKIASVLGMTMAPLIRSLFIVSWIGVFIPLMISSQRKKYMYLILSPLCFIVSIILHWKVIFTMAETLVHPLSEWLRGGFLHFWITLTFGYPLNSQWIYIIPLYLILPIVSIYIHKKDLTLWTIAGGCIVPMIFFLIIGPPTFRQYWGIIYLPVLLLLCSLSLSAFLHLKNPEEFQEEDTG